MATLVTKNRRQHLGTATGSVAHTRADGHAAPNPLDALVHRAEALEAEARRLHDEARLARGSRDLTMQAPAVVADVVTAAPAKPDATSQLYRDAEAALRVQPRTFRDLCAALAIDESNENRLKSVIVRLQRDGHNVVNLGNGARAIWWIDEHDRIGAIAADRRRAPSPAKK